MNTNSNCKKGINWKKLLFTMLCGVVAFSTMFLTACGKKKDPSDPTPPEVGGDWYTGAELPTANTGSLGDFYFKTDSYQVYKLCDDGWKLIVELSSLLGQEGVSWHYGNDEPSEFVGVPGDYYLDQTDGDIYFSGSNGWEKVYNLMGVSTDQVADGEVAEVYIGYDGYVWIGDSRTTHRPKTIVGANDIVDNTLELKKGYFTSMQLDTTSHAVALMSGYKVVNEGEANEYATTSYSHTTLTNIQFYADADGLLELAVANVKDVLAKVTAGQEIESTTKAVVEVKEGFNNLTVSVVVGYNETLVLGGTNTTSKLYVVTGVTADDDYGVISSVNEGNKKFNATDGIKDKLVLKAKAGAHTILTESYIKTETTHGHPCANCSTVFEVENHTYQNGVCTVCNYSHINHSSTVYDNISSSTHSKICDVCGITYGEGNHTYGEHTSIDYAKHYQECTECGYRVEGTHNYLNATCTDCGYIHVNHLSTNYDNVNNDEHSKVCDVCGQIYALDFHTFNSYTSFDKTKHYRQCSICQYIRYEDHNFLNSTCVDCNYTCTEHNYTNGECTCGATHPCPGNGEFVFVTENTVDDKCIKECSECGLQVELTHNYIDGVCSNCAHSHQAHEYTLGVCDICDFEHQNHNCDTYTKIDNEKHGKTCEVCHVVYDVVDHTLSEYKVYNIHQHYRNCTACDYVVSESHNYIDGTCTICNHTCSSHEYTNGECVCGYDHECDLVNSYTYSSASGDANCLRTCTICNRQTELAHDYENGECANCEHNHTEHNWSNGACTECEVEHDNHTFGEFAYQDSATHGKVCSTCGLVSEIGNHNYVDSTCTICNHTCTSHEWEDGACTNCHITHDCEAGDSFSHANATDDLCIKNCTTCGKAYTNAEHGYYLGTCVYCGHSHVNHIEDDWTIDDEYHWIYCSVCMVELESGEHNLGEIDKSSSDIQNHYRYCSICERGVGEEHTYQDGVCTECDYECEHMWSNGTCSNCHITHDCGADWDVSAVYVGEEGWHDIVCNICHARYGSDPHNYNGDATCDDCNYIHTNHTYENGICTVCGHECEHSFGELKDLNGGEHYRECFICKYQEIDNHEFGTGSTCSVCGHTCVHSWDSGYCEFCGIAHDCESEGIYKFSIVDSITHIKNCGICNNYIGEYEHNMIKWEYEDEVHHFGTCVDCKLDDLAAHRYENGKCKDCEHECEHYMEGCECRHCDYENHTWNFGVCTECDYECEHDIEDCECTICDYENHSWNYGTCSQCGGSHDCSKESDYSYYDYGSDDDCRVTCGICYNEWSAGHDYVNGECLNCEHVHSEHLYDENHYCKCGIHNCAEEDNFEIVEYSDVLHAKKCVDCGKVVETNKHTLDANNVCTVCGNEHTTHSYNLYEGSDGIRHFYECVVCEHTYYEYHNFDGIGYGAICTVCNIVHDQCVIEEYDRYDYVEHYGDCVCGNSMAGAHSFNNGECTQCDFVCNHIEWSNGKCVNCRKEHENHTFGDFENKDSSRHARKCSVCNYEDLADHTFEDGVCTVCNCECVHEYSWKRCTKCGKEHDCAGEGTLTRSVNGNEYCSMYCGICYYEDFDGQNYVNGVCTLCEHVCTHYFYDGKCNYCKTPHNCSTDTIVNFSEQYHYCKCVCDAYIEIPHDWRDGVCSTCNYVCEHEYEEDDYLYYCTICSKHNCEECDDFQYVDLENGYHSRFCYECEKTVEIKHEWTENRRCEKCDAKCLHTEYDEYYNCLECGNHNCYADDADYYVKVNDEQCRMYCDSCDFEEVFAHNFENCECTYCGYSIHSFKPVTPEDEEDHKKECANCGLILLEGHNWSSSVCTECGYECIDHVFDSSYVGECYCMYCDYENHSWDEGHCVDCAAEHECCENDFEYRGTANYCIATCSVCGRYTNGAHEYENGVCTVCGYEHDCANNGTVSNGYCVCGKAHNCAETNKFNYTSEWNYECIKTCILCGTSNTIDHAYDSNSVCANCGNVCGHYYASWHNDGLCAYCYAPHEDHTFEDDYCTVCYKHDCTTANEFSYTTKDDVICIEKCLVCELSREIEHKYRSASGDCDYCGHYHQNHKNAKPTMSDDSRHSLSCEICGIDLGFEDHNYNVVQENDYEHRKICEDCDHVCFESHKCVDSKCTLCGYECVNHEISNCVCTICGFENHIYNIGECERCGYKHVNHNFSEYEQDGTSEHRRECSVCGYVEFENHTWDNSKCTVCEYECVNHEINNCECSICDYENHSWNLGTCEDCGYTHSNHVVGTVRMLDDQRHVLVCAVCKAEYKTEDHNFGEYVEYDNVDHYRACTGCGYKVYSGHTYGENCECVCGRPGHTWSGNYCTECGVHDCKNAETVNYRESDTDEYCIGSCSECGSEYVGTHSYTWEECDNCGHLHSNHEDYWYYAADQYYHYKTCSECHYDIIGDHTYENGECTVCGYKES